MISNLLKRNSIIFLDSMIFIYHYENHPDFIDLTKVCFKHIENGLSRGLTSVISVAELLVKPYELKDYRIIEDYYIALEKFPNLTILNIDYHIANISASVSAKYNLDLPDALQIACALSNNATLFLTNDSELKKIEEIEVVTLSDLLKS